MNFKIVITVLLSITLSACRRTLVLTQEAANPATLEKKQMRRILRRSTVVLSPPPSGYTRLRRTNPNHEALACGRIVVLEGINTSRPFPGAISRFNRQSYVSADENGYYILPLAPGKHKLQAGAVGLFFSQPLALTVEQGDSIIINYELLPDFRPLH
ncbi:hypothetical protein [Hymenobacter glacieicola]|uniref:hypothetical protein n=1 Tax=Hymenobacter glacieicola TaxID=1562124 RepID=UPI0016691E0A|nr:hypothetical protein [Hymenobacter glacieicola]